MIEDALKSTRLFHRLIMSVAVVTLVFSLSIGLPEDKVAQKATVDQIIETNFLEYEDFVKKKVEAAENQRLKPIGEGVTRELESAGHLLFGLEQIGVQISHSSHIGKISTGELVLSEIANASIEQLDALNGLSLNQDVQIVLPKTESLTDEIRAFLDSNQTTGKRIESVSVSMDDFNFVAETFLPDGETRLGIYFELVDSVRTAGAPTFSANFDAEIVSIPNSSFIDWLEAQGFADSVVSIRGEEIVFAANLDSPPNGFRTEKLGVLSLNLADQIAESSPTNQSVSILGATVPGSLVIFAAPLTLLSLAYYFMNHTQHLRSLARTNSATFREFVWLPLSMQKAWQSQSQASGAYTSTMFEIGSWQLEIAFTTIVLPIGALAVLVFQLYQFDDLGFLQYVLIFGAMIGICLFGYLAAQNLYWVRRVIQRARRTENWKTEIQAM